MANEIRITEETVKSENILQYIKCFQTTQDNRYKCLVDDCNTILGSSSTAIRHLKSRHQNIVDSIHNLKKDQNQDDSIEFKFRVSPTIFWNAIIHIIVFGAIAFTILKSKGFQYLINPFVAAFRSSGVQCSVNRINVQSKIDERAKEIKNIIKNEVDGKMVCLLLDIASRYNRSVFGINIAYFHNGKVRYRTIGMHSLKISQTARNLYDIVLSKLSEFGIVIDQIFAVTTDNGKNLIKLSKLIESELSNSNESEGEMDENSDDDDSPESQENYHNAFDEPIDEYLFDPEIFNEEYFRDLLQNVRKEFNCSYDGLFTGITCAAHGLHLVVIKALSLCNGIELLVQKCRVVVKKLRTPNLRGVLDERGKKSAVLDVKTRWSSTFNMVNKAIKLSYL